jgi:hypothetical protein
MFVMPLALTTLLASRQIADWGIQNQINNDRIKLGGVFLAIFLTLPMTFG